jgi:acyl-coenzyme A thioesterase 13
MTGVTVQLNVQYMKAVAVGEEILIKCTTDKVGKRLAFLSVDITNHKTGDLIVKGTHTKYVGS